MLDADAGSRGSGTDADHHPRRIQPQRRARWRAAAHPGARRRSRAAGAQECGGGHPEMPALWLPAAQQVQGLARARPRLHAERHLLNSYRMPPPPVALSDDYRRVLNREVLRTERLRVTSLIVTVALLLGVAAVLFLIWPDYLDRMIRHRNDVWIPFAVGVPFIVFECGVLLLLRRDLALDRQIPPIRRYIGVLIETSLPTVGIAIQMHRIGPLEALGFMLPLTYFLFIVLSTLRLDFWLSAFTGLVAAAGLAGLALFHPDMPTGSDQPMLAPGYHIGRSLILLIAGV